MGPDTFDQPVKSIAVNAGKRRKLLFGNKPRAVKLCHRKNLDHSSFLESHSDEQSLMKKCENIASVDKVNKTLIPGFPVDLLQEWLTLLKSFDVFGKLRRDLTDRGPPGHVWHYGDLGMVPERAISGQGFGIGNV